MFKELELSVAWSLHTMKNVNLVTEGNLRYLQILWEWSTKLQITDGPKKNHKQSGQNLKEIKNLIYQSLWNVK